MGRWLSVVISLAISGSIVWWYWPRPPELPEPPIEVVKVIRQPIPKRVHQP
jgi:hypothetical protein